MYPGIMQNPVGDLGIIDPGQHLPDRALAVDVVGLAARGGQFVLGVGRSFFAAGGKHAG